MTFDELDKTMRVFETTGDVCVLPEIHMVARLDGRGFTRLTKETLDYARPFDERFRDLMIATCRHLMDCGFRVVFAHTQSDEISLLLVRDEKAFGRKLRKCVSVLAGEASAVFSLGVGMPAVFDCRVSQLPNAGRVVDYFRWRSADCLRNSLNAHCYWRLRGEGLSVTRATRQLTGMTVEAKHELLFQRGVNFNDLPAWQKRGVGLHWTTHTKPAINQKTGETVIAERRQIDVNLELPMGADYESWLRSMIERDKAKA